jgi:phage anti-repressor protein
MENELIQLVSLATGEPAVSGRALHVFLEVKKDFTDWMKLQIKRAGLLEKSDFDVRRVQLESPSAGRPATDYLISLRAAMNIALLSKTGKGKQAKQYLVECENRLKELSLTEVKTLREDLHQLNRFRQSQTELEQQRAYLQAELEYHLPKSQFVDSLAKELLQFAVKKMVTSEGPAEEPPQVSRQAELSPEPQVKKPDFDGSPFDQPADWEDWLVSEEASSRSEALKHPPDGEYDLSVAKIRKGKSRKDPECWYYCVTFAILGTAWDGYLFNYFFNIGHKSETAREKSEAKWTAFLQAVGAEDERKVLRANFRGTLERADWRDGSVNLGTFSL